VTEAAAEHGLAWLSGPSPDVGAWAARQRYLTLAATSRDPADFWSARAYAGLRSIKAAVDPDDLIRSNHPVPGSVDHAPLRS
jgi:hypothetical protein